MKKLMTIFGAFFFASVVLTSCGSEATADGEKACKIKCELESAENMEETEENVKKITKLFNDGLAFAIEMKEKYKDDEKGQGAYNAAMAACKCD